MKEIIRIGRTRKWNADDMQSFCIRHQYYTRGDCKAYEEMLNFVNTNEPSIENLYDIAIDILKHSEGIKEPDDIMILMDELEVSVVTTSYFYMD